MEKQVDRDGFIFVAKDTVDKIRKSTEQLDEWNEDLRKDYFRQNVVKKAVDIADRIIMEATDGSAEETNYLTGKVAEAFMSKVLMSLQTQMFKKDIGIVAEG